jgi:hypothetical protein
MSPCHFQHRREEPCLPAVRHVSIDETNRQESASHRHVQPEPMLRLRSEDANGWPFRPSLCFLRISELHGSSGAPLSSCVYSVSQADTSCIQRQADFNPAGPKAIFHRSFTMSKRGARLCIDIVDPSGKSTLAPGPHWESIIAPKRGNPTFRSPGHPCVFLSTSLHFKSSWAALVQSGSMAVGKKGRATKVGDA